MRLVNTFDVEPWWATIPACIPIAEWSSMPDRSEHQMHEYLNLCDIANVKCTFFFVAWYAQKYPCRVREVIDRGHEVGCHSLFHEDISRQSIQDFNASTKKAKLIIEDAAGVSINAYRAPSFSIPYLNYDAYLNELANIGFDIDSSICTAMRIHGGGFSRKEFSLPINLKLQSGKSIFEIPVPGVSFMGREMQFFGGGYLRVAPPKLINKFIKKESYQVLYLHPHDFDPDLPSLPNIGILGNARRKLRIGDLKQKVLNIFAGSDVYSCGEIRCLS